MAPRRSKIEEGQWSRLNQRARSAAEAARWRDDILHPAFPVAAVKDQLEMQMIVIEYLNHGAFT